MNQDQAACCIFAFRPGGRSTLDGLELIAKRLDLAIDLEQATFALRIEANSIKVAQAIVKRRPHFGSPTAEEKQMIDRHLAEALDVERYPDIVCTGELRGRADVHAELQFRGTRRPVTCTLAPAGENRQVAEVLMHLPDFDIARPGSELAAIMEPDILIRIMMSLKLG